ncbi:MAG: FlgO family outer membrane protein [Brevinematales bacterium]
MRRAIWSGVLFVMVWVLFFGNEGKTIAILDLKNLSQQAAYDFLSSSLAETFVTVFAKNKDIKVVERQQLKSLIQEQKLVLTGLVETDVSNSLRIGSLLSAQYLLLGSYTVVKDRVEVNARLVDVFSGVVVLAEKREAVLGDALFAAVQEMAEKMSLAITGSGVGYLSFETSPSGAEVRVGDEILGYTPIAKRMMKPATYDFTVTLKNYEVYRKSVTIKEGETTKVFLTLTKQAGEVRPFRTTIGLHFLPLLLGDPYQPFFNIGIVEYLNRGFILGMEYGGNFITHRYSTNLPGGKNFEEIQLLYYHRLDLLVKYAFFYQNRYISPYLGVGAGIVFPRDRDTTWEDVRFYAKGIGGFTLFPTSQVSPFVEMTYYTTSPSELVLRYRVVNLFGDYNIAEKNVVMQNLFIGVGLQFAY